MEVVCPGERAVGVLESRALMMRGSLCRGGTPVEFRRKVLDLIEAGRPIAEVAVQLGVSDSGLWETSHDVISVEVLPGRAALSRPRIQDSQPCALAHLPPASLRPVN